MSNEPIKVSIAEAVEASRDIFHVGRVRAGSRIWPLPGRGILVLHPDEPPYVLHYNGTKEPFTEPLPEAGLGIVIDVQPSPAPAARVSLTYGKDTEKH